MKVGLRTPSLKKSLKARTTGKLKRSMKKAVNPLYGKKGIGYIKNPSKALKNKVYHKTTFGVSDITKTDANGISFKVTKEPVEEEPKHIFTLKERIIIAIVLVIVIGVLNAILNGNK